MITDVKKRRAEVAPLEKTNLLMLGNDDSKPITLSGYWLSSTEWCDYNNIYITKSHCAIRGLFNDHCPWSQNQSCQFYLKMMRHDKYNKDDFYQSEKPLMLLGCLSRIDESSLFLIVHIATFFGRDICWWWLRWLLREWLRWWLWWWFKEMVIGRWWLRWLLREWLRWSPRPKVHSRHRWELQLGAGNPGLGFPPWFLLSLT